MWDKKLNRNQATASNILILKKMKKTVVLLVLLFVADFVNAQLIKPETFYIEIPDLPMNVSKKEIREPFLKKVDKLSAELKEEISFRKSKVKGNNKDFDEKAAKQMAEQNGVSVSPGDIQKMKSGKMSQEAYRAMADKMLQQSMNVSIDDAKDASKMSKSGQKAWSEGMSTEMMADAQKNPKKNQATQTKNMGMLEMTQEQSRIAQKIQANRIKFDDQLETYKKIKEKSRLEYENCVKSVDKQFENKVNHTLGDEYYESIKLEKDACYNNYCGYLVPKYKDILRDRLDAINAMGDDYYLLDNITNELNYTTSGNKKPAIDPGLTYLEALDDYMNHLRDIP
jgi:hypothetical protein